MPRISTIIKIRIIHHQAKLVVGLPALSFVLVGGVVSRSVVATSDGSVSESVVEISDGAVSVDASGSVDSCGVVVSSGVVEGGVVC
jgi:hypothetical protein